MKFCINFLALLSAGIYMDITPSQQHSLVNIKTIIPDIALDIRYATTNNFTGKVVYSHAECFLLEHVACALKKVQDDLKKQNLGLKIFDGYRPHAIQYIFWELVPDPRYVGDPKKGSKHNRGCAVDVTLLRLEDGAELAMPTEFDDFTERAHSDYTDLPQEVKANRQLLRDAMEQHGFTVLPTEWWHFDYKDWVNHPILDIPLEELVK